MAHKVSRTSCVYARRGSSGKLSTAVLRFRRNVATGRDKLRITIRHQESNSFCRLWMILSSVKSLCYQWKQEAQNQSLIFRGLERTPFTASPQTSIDYLQILWVSYFLPAYLYAHMDFLQNLVSRSVNIKKIKNSASGCGLVTKRDSQCEHDLIEI